MQQVTCLLLVLVRLLLFQFTSSKLTALRDERSSPQNLNQRPIIGVLDQETDGSDKKYGESYLTNTYVKFMEQSGAQVVPIHIKQSDEYYLDIFSKINAVVFPGGNVNITESEFTKAGRILYNLALEANHRNDFFPILGICQGFELLTVLTSDQNLLSQCDAEDLPLNLDFTTDAQKSRLFKNLPKSLKEGFATEAISYNFHHLCLTSDDYSTSILKSFYRVVTTNFDRNQLKFVSTMEAYDYPFYATQWHPEKNLYWWDLDAHIEHSRLATRASQFVANFFVDEAKKSKHRFPNFAEEASASIANYCPVFLGLPSFETNYYFNLTSMN